MIDGIIKADGTSRLMRAELPATYEAFRAQCLAGAQPLDVLFNALGWSQLPTFLNKGNLASDDTLALFGLSASAVPDDIFRVLSRFQKGLGNEYIWAKKSVAGVWYVVEGTEEDWIQVPSDENFYRILYKTAKAENGKVVLSDPESVYWEDVVGKYVEYNGIPYKITGFEGAYSSLEAVELSAEQGTESEVVGYVNSPDPNAYPVDDDYAYTALGQLGNKVQIATGSYVGTGTGTKNYPNSLTFDFEPKFIMVASKIMDTLEGNANVRQMDVMVLLPTVGGFSSIGFTSASTLFSVGASVTGNTVSWWAKAAEYQMNRSGGTFNYIAIG